MAGLPASSLLVACLPPAVFPSCKFPTQRERGRDRERKIQREREGERERERDRERPCQEAKWFEELPDGRFDE